MTQFSENRAGHEGTDSPESAAHQKLDFGKCQEQASASVEGVYQRIWEAELNPMNRKNSLLRGEIVRQTAEGILNANTSEPDSEENQRWLSMLETFIYRRFRDLEEARHHEKRLDKLNQRGPAAASAKPDRQETAKAEILKTIDQINEGLDEDRHE